MAKRLTSHELAALAARHDAIMIEAQTVLDASARATSATEYALLRGRYDALVTASAECVRIAREAVALDTDSN